MTERPRIDGADEAELDAITREIHAQLRASYGLPPEAAPPTAPMPLEASAAKPRPAPADLGRFLGAFLLPPLAMVVLLLLLRMVKDGF